MSHAAETLPTNQLLCQKRVLLSASIPPTDLVELRQRPDAWEDFYRGFLVEPREVETAVRGIIGQLLGCDVTVVFGGHPAITPIITALARRVQQRERLSVAFYQSAFFAGQEPLRRRQDPEVYQQIQWIPICQPTVDGFDPMTESFELGEYPLDRDDHLQAAAKLRELDEGSRKDCCRASLDAMRQAMVRDCDAGLFIGGMGGVEDELNLFVEHNPGKPAYLVAGAGGRAARLARQYATKGPPYVPAMDRDYDYIGVQILAALASD